MNKVFRTYINVCDRISKPMAIIYMIAIGLTYIAIAIKCKKEGRAFTKHVFSESWSTLFNVLHD